jgi:hypothetical protein
MAQATDLLRRETTQLAHGTATPADAAGATNPKGVDHRLQQA